MSGRVGLGGAQLSSRHGEWGLVGELGVMLGMDTDQGLWSSGWVSGTHPSVPPLCFPG